jgi:DNA topoisomerase-1
MKREQTSTTQMPSASTPVEPQEAARAAHLRYVHDDRPGISRERGKGDAFLYRDADGKRITEKATMARIEALRIPPAYTDVWICPIPNGHLQATGRDARGRKQYRYHVRWRMIRDAVKYDRMLAFGAALPRIRAQVAKDLMLHGLPREKVLAAIVRLLERTRIRVGNEEYAQSNDSYGLTTLRNQHADIEGGTIHFHFRGKSGKEHEIDLRDPRVARIVDRCQELPGQELFQFVDQEGTPHPIDSGDVNEYLKAAADGEEFTAKDFRTWSGTVLCALRLAACTRPENPAEAKHTVVEAIRTVAAQLGNTPAVCRKSYIHPAIVEAFLDGGMASALTVRSVTVDPDMDTVNNSIELTEDEVAVLKFLCNRLKNG